MNKIIVEVSVGELLDKISILEIKQGKIKDPEKLNFINNEHSILKNQLEKNVKSDDKLEKLFQDLKDINARNGMIRAMAERNAINAPIQGSAADIIKIAMIEVDKEMQNRAMKSKMLLQVHDELVFDMNKDEEQELKNLVKMKMEQAVKLQVPLIVDIGEGANWLDAH